MSDDTTLTPDQPALDDPWEKHLRYEFQTRDTDAAPATMAADTCVNHVPAMTGGVGRAARHDFYSRRFIPRMPSDTDTVPVSRTIGRERVVDERIFRFTHRGADRAAVEVDVVVIVDVRDGKIAHEHIYWDQVSVLVQLGLLDPAGLPVTGAASARTVLDSHLPANELIDGAGA